jgi:hypothetical protein
MHGYQRYVAAPLQLEDRCQLQARKVFQDVENGFFVHAVLDIGIALFAREHDQAIGSDFVPEGHVIHWLKPVLNVVYVSEFHGEYSISNQLSGLQISVQFQGGL